MKPLGKVRREWDPDMAYAVGLIATDGCLFNDGRHIDFTSQDYQLTETFRQCLNLHVIIGRKGNAYRVEFGDVLFYRWLQEIGLTPRKSLTIKKILVPAEYFFDFLRGCFDGDGSIWSFWDKRWRRSFVFYLVFASGSLPFLQWLQTTTKDLLGISGHIVPWKTANQLRYGKKEGN